MCSKSKAQTADWDWKDAGITYWIRYWICRGFIIANDGIEHSDIQSRNTCFKDLPLKFWKRVSACRNKFIHSLFTITSKPTNKYLHHIHQWDWKSPNQAQKCSCFVVLNSRKAQTFDMHSHMKMSSQSGWHVHILAVNLIYYELSFVNLAFHFHIIINF